jgi:hypothetical protein
MLFCLFVNRRLAKMAYAIERVDLSGVGRSFLFA